MKIFKALAQDPGLEWEFIDGNTVKAHQHSTSASSCNDEGIGKSVAANTKKYMWQLMHMDCQLILKLLVLKHMIARLPLNLLRRFQFRITKLQIKVTTLKKYANVSERTPRQQSLEEKIIPK